jgi:uncharacterized membrane protein
MPTAVFDSPSISSRAHRRLLIALTLVTILAVVFIAAAALPYFRLDETQFRDYWPRRWWLLLHITTGMVALLAGPVQLWLGLTDRRPELHRRLGTVYLLAVAVSSIAAFYLAFHTSGGIAFGAGLGGLAIAWLVTSGMALAAIRRHLIDQHKEWMIRSYVVTTAFISFRVLFLVLQNTGTGTLQEQLAIASWFCWAVPLLVTEAWLQGRKIGAVRLS